MFSPGKVSLDLAIKLLRVLMAELFLLTQRALSILMVRFLTVTTTCSGKLLYLRIRTLRVPAAVGLLLMFDCRI